jgi:hypothetical protein
VSLWWMYQQNTYHGDTEDTEDALRRAFSFFSKDPYVLLPFQL